MDGADVGSLFQQIGSKAVAQGVYGGMLGNARMAHRQSESTLENGRIQGMPPDYQRAGINRQTGRRECPEEANSPQRMNRLSLSSAGDAKHLNIRKI